MCTNLILIRNLLRKRGSQNYTPMGIFLIGQAKRAPHWAVQSRFRVIYYIPPPLTVHFPMTRSVRYQPILHTLYYTLHTEHAYCLSYRFFNNVVATNVIEMVEILYGRLGKRSVEQVRYVINRNMESFHSYSVFPLAFGS